MTPYYVHPQNEARDKTTNLCQPIGEALILLKTCFSDLAGLMRDGFRPESKEPTPFSFVMSTDGSKYQLRFQVPEVYREANVVALDIYGYVAEIVGQSINVAGIARDGHLIAFDFPFVLSDEYSPLMAEATAWWLPAFMLLMLRDMVRNEALRTEFIRFAIEPLVDQFVRIHEDFYQEHKRHHVNAESKPDQLSDTANWRDGLGNFHPVFFEELAADDPLAVADVEISGAFEPYPPDRFTADAQEMIPRLPREFQIQSRSPRRCAAETVCLFCCKGLPAPVSRSLVN